MRRLFNFEKKHEPIATRAVFHGRLTRNGFLSLATVVLSLFLGCSGYMYFEGMSVLDAFANAAMILSGMGPIAPLKTSGGKIFASLYAIASGLLLFAIAGLMLAPIYHRILHRFHMDEEETGEPAPRPGRRKR
jgi:hypothetical protein